MKNIFLVSILVLVFACEEKVAETTVPLSARIIVGEWQLSETYISPGGETEWQSVENGDVFNFKNDGMFSQNQTSEDANYRTGTFTYADDILTLAYLQDGEKKNQIFHVDLEGATMTISPGGPVFCTEACLYRYKRIN